MDKESTDADQVSQRWSIDLDWYRQNSRSFSALAQGGLCSNCSERLRGGEISVTHLLSAIKDCCSQTPGFITRQLPILESIFRLFLASGNQPIDLEELGKQFSKWREGYTNSTSPVILSCLLSSDQYYGFRQVED